MRGPQLVARVDSLDGNWVRCRLQYEAKLGRPRQIKCDAEALQDAEHFLSRMGASLQRFQEQSGEVVDLLLPGAEA